MENAELLNLKHIIASAGLGTWRIELPKDAAPRMIADEQMLELMEISDRNLTPEEVYEWWFSRIKPEAVDSVLKSVEKMQKGQKDENTYLWVHPTLGERYVRCGGTAEKVGDVVVLQGYHYDVDSVVRQNEKTVNLINALSMVYLDVLFVDLQKGTTRPIKMDEDVKLMDGGIYASEEHPYSMKTYVEKNVYPEDQALFAPFLTIENCKEYFAQHKEYSFNYRVNRNGDNHYMQVRVVRPDAARDEIAIGFKIVDDEEAKRLENLRREHELLGVVGALSSEYVSVYL